jgi:hypothetical protein
VIEPHRVCFVQRAADLPEDLRDAAARLRSVLADELLKIDSAAEVLHRVIEDAVVAAAVVVDGDRVRMGELTHRLHLAFEAREDLGTDAIGEHLFDRRRSPQHHVMREVDDAHATFTDLAIERVLAELLRGLDLLAQAVDGLRAVRRHHGRHDAEQ